MVATSNPERGILSALWHGLGLFGESYILFSVGVLRPIWEKLYPLCFDEFDTSQCYTRGGYQSYQSITYSAVVGIMIGMVAIGALATKFGRRHGSILTAALMSGGSALLTLCSLFLSGSPSALFPCMSISFFFFGIGVGGEYPLSASSASERALLKLKQRQDEEKSLGANSNRKMRRLLSGADDSSGGTTPRAANSSRDAAPWKTLEEWKVSANEVRGDNRALTPVTEDYGQTIPTSPTNTTRDTIDSLSSYNAKYRTKGREVLLVFSCQGLGIFMNSLVLTLLLATTRTSGDNAGDDDNLNDESDYQPSTLVNIWRITYAVGTAVLIYVFVSRLSHLAESEVWLNDKAQREEDKIERDLKQTKSGDKGSYFGPYERQINKSYSGKEPVINHTMSSITMRSDFDQLGSTNVESGCCGGALTKLSDGKMILLLRHYGVRLFGTSAVWLLWDVSFYGNKLFQSTFLLALAGENASLAQITGASAVNSFVALLGYYASAYIIDDPDCGRLTLQQLGLAITGILFLVCGKLSDQLSSAWLIIIYFGSSFFGQCGPNCTTFLIPAEAFPTEMRSLCHGISASCGKLGALIAAIMFHLVDEHDLFLCSAYSSFAACAVSFLTIPETTSLDLFEIDKQWRLILDERQNEYEGPATDPRHLSFWERNQARMCFWK